MNIRKIIFFILFLSVFACKKNKQHPVPYYSFDTYINLNLPTYQNLQGVGGWAYISGVGSKGIVVYRQSMQNFVAWDRQSPADEGLDCQSGLVVNEDNYLILDDPCSNSQYSLYDGSVISGGGKWGLRKYETQYTGGSSLRVYNP